MEITTIVGIIITILVMLYGLRLMFKKPSEAVPSLDAELHIEPESQKPVIPRHVRDQLNITERIEPVLDQQATTTDEPQPELGEITAVTEAEEPKLAANEAIIETSESFKAKQQEAEQLIPPVDVVDEEIAHDEKTPKNPPEFTLNSHIETAQISDFEDESSILDAHLYEQKLVDDESALATAQDFIALNVYPERRMLSGEKTLKVLLKYGLRYGEMRCFHRYSEDGSRLLFSVLEITDDGANGFDLETLSTQQVKGLAFFLALPHSDVQNAFDTMDSLSKLIAREIEGVVLDQNDQEFTPQLREYWRHQAIDYRIGHPVGA